MKPKKTRKRPSAFWKPSNNPLTHHLQIASAAEARRFGPHFSPLTPPKPSYPVKALHRWRYLAKIQIDDGWKYMTSGTGREHFADLLRTRLRTDPLDEVEQRAFARGGWLWVGR